MLFPRRGGPFRTKGVTEPAHGRLVTGGARGIGLAIGGENLLKDGLACCTRRRRSELLRAKARV
jgi:hypothetical protein